MMEVFISDQNLHRFFAILFLYLLHSFSFDNLRRYIKLLRQGLITFPNPSNFIKNTPLRVVFSTQFLGCGNVIKSCLSGLIYYIQS